MINAARIWLDCTRYRLPHVHTAVVHAVLMHARSPHAFGWMRTSARTRTLDLYAHCACAPVRTAHHARTLLVYTRFWVLRFSFFSAVLRYGSGLILHGSRARIADTFYAQFTRSTHALWSLQSFGSFCWMFTLVGPPAVLSALRAVAFWLVAVLHTRFCHTTATHAFCRHRTFCTRVLLVHAWFWITAHSSVICARTRFAPYAGYRAPVHLAFATHALVIWLPGWVKFADLVYAHRGWIKFVRTVLWIFTQLVRIFLSRSSAVQSLFCAIVGHLMVADLLHALFCLFCIFFCSLNFLTFLHVHSVRPHGWLVTARTHTRCAPAAFWVLVMVRTVALVLRSRIGSFADCRSIISAHHVCQFTRLRMRTSARSRTTAGYVCCRSSGSWVRIFSSPALLCTRFTLVHDCHGCVLWIPGWIVHS